MVVMTEEKALFSINEAARILNVSTDTIRRMIKSEELIAIKIHNRWRIRKESVEKFLGK